ncbi:MAG: hypothetical protein WBD09_04610 [Halobacteriota archaeon]
MRKEMGSEHGKILCMGVVAVLLLSLVVWTGIAAAVAAEEEEDKGEVPVIAAYGAQGFALKVDGEEFHTLRLHIIWVRQIDPAVIRELMEEDISIEELRGELRDIEKGQVPFYHGYMRFVGKPYRLVNISVTPEGANFTINADVLDTLQGGSVPNESLWNAGNVSVTVTDYEGARIGEGELTMYDEKYRVLLGVFHQ